MRQNMECTLRRDFNWMSFLYFVLTMLLVFCISRFMTILLLVTLMADSCNAAAFKIEAMHQNVEYTLRRDFNRMSLLYFVLTVLLVFCISRFMTILLLVTLMADSCHAAAFRIKAMRQNVECTLRRDFNWMSLLYFV